MRLFLAIPTSGSPTAPFLTSLGSLELPATITSVDRITIAGNFIPGQRELAVRRALSIGADILVMIDDDMVLPSNAIVALTAALTGDPRLGIVGGLYYSRDGLHPMVADHWSSADTTTAAIPAYDDALTYCDAVGFGCVAIRGELLRGLRVPFFSTQVYVEESAARVRICNEDYLFCERARQDGWRVALHAGVRCKHFDRESGISYPTQWESASATSIARMLVTDPGPSYRMIPYDGSAPTKPEHHEAAKIDYIIVD